MSKFNLVSESVSTTEGNTPAYVDSPLYTSDDDEDNLPYPTDLARADFLKADFDPQEYLSSLRDRHQALEDLRADLRSRSQLLNQELLDLVNNNYEEFLSLGSDLNGGEEKVEGVRVGLLGFIRDIKALRSVVVSREVEFSNLLLEKKQTRREIVLGRKLLEIEANVTTLEEGLGLSSAELIEDDSETDEDEHADAGQSSDLRRTSRRVESYTILQQQIRTIEANQPFLQSLAPRLQEIRKVLILDISTAMRKARIAQNSDDILLLSNMFNTIGAEHEATQLLKAK